MKLGKNICRIVDYGITKTKLGTAQVFVRLSFEDGTESTWYGVAFKKDGTTNDIMLQQLAYCGFDLSTNEIESLAMGPVSNLLTMDEDLDVYCRNEMGPSGETVMRISSIGSIGPSRCDNNEAKTLISEEQSKLLKSVAGKFKPRVKKQVKSIVEDPNEVIPF